MSANTKGRRKKAAHAEEHVNHERWLITYGDMLTLLMVLFIVLFAISQVDQKKFNELKDGMAAGFGTSPQLMDGSASVLPASAMDRTPFDPHSGMIIRPDVAGDLAKETTKEVTSGAARAKQASDQLKKIIQAANMAMAKARIEGSLQAAGLSKDVLMQIDERGLVVSLITNKALFDADSAQLRPVTRTLLAAIAPALHDLPNNVAVEGHTNTVPVKPKNFPTEWELSSARAVTVARYLISAGVQPRRVSATGLADQHPLLPASDPRSTAANRRVDVVVLADLGLIPDVKGASVTVPTTTTTDPTTTGGSHG